MAKISFSIGDVSFELEGSEQWVQSSWESSFKSMVAFTGSMPNTNMTGSSNMDGVASKPLGILLKETQADKNPQRKYLATAAWLHAKGQKRVTTALVNKALKDNNQVKLSHPSRSLADNKKEGFIEKDGERDFFVTEEGLKKLGIANG